MKKYLTIALLICISNLQAQCWSDVSAYWYQSFGIYNNGSLWGWGSNGADLLQVGDYVSRDNPVQVGTDSDWDQLYMGSNYVLALKTNGTLWAWGYNDEGQLGDGTTVNKVSPVQIGSATWLKISAGHKSSYGIQSDGSLWAWGKNSAGELGDGTSIQRLIPIQISSGTTWSDVSANFNHTLAIQSNGTLWSWGDNGFGQLGDGTNVSRNSPTQVGGSASWQSLSHSPSSQFSLAIQSNGTLWAWGYNAYGQLGTGTTGAGVASNPIQVGTDSNWLQVACGSDHTLALKSDSTLWSWGGNYVGQLGDGSTTQSNSPIQVGTGSNWKSISAGQGHSMALRSDGNAYSWGYNGFGQLGDGSQTNNPNPAIINCSVVLGNVFDNLVSQVLIYPNPTSTNLVVTMPEDSEVEYISIVDLSGKKVHQQNGYFEPIPINHLKNGFYIVKIGNFVSETSFKMIKN